MFNKTEGHFSETKERKNFVPRVSLPIQVSLIKLGSINLDFFEVKNFVLNFAIPW